LNVRIFGDVAAYSAVRVDGSVSCSRLCRVLRNCEEHMQR